MSSFDVLFLLAKTGLCFVKKKFPKISFLVKNDGSSREGEYFCTDHVGNKQWLHSFSVTRSVLGVK